MNLSRRNFLRGAAAVVAVATIKPAIPVGAYVKELPSWCPKGFLPCDGRAVLRSQYSKLFSVLGSRYGGTDLTFNLPNLDEAPGGHPLFNFVTVLADGSGDMPAGMAVARIVKKGEA